MFFCLFLFLKILLYIYVIYIIDLYNIYLYYAYIIEIFVFKYSLHPTWSLNLQPRDQEAHAPVTEPPRHPQGNFEALTWVYVKPLTTTDTIQEGEQFLLEVRGRRKVRKRMINLVWEMFNLKCPRDV